MNPKSHDPVRSDREALLYLVSLIKVYASEDPKKGTGPRRPPTPA